LEGVVEDGIEGKGDGALGECNVGRGCVAKEYDREEESKGDYRLTLSWYYTTD
jgi:hypothetical protein